MNAVAPGAYHIWTIGCQMNEADTRRLAARLEALGWREAADPDSADLLVLNTCVVRRQAEDKALGRLAQARAQKRRRPDRIVALMGCLVGERMDPALRERFDFVDVFLPPSDPGPLLRRLAAADAAEAPGEAPLPARLRRSVRAHVPAVLGCSLACAYCVIPYRRGPERSRPAGEILDEIRALLAQGVREIVLLGQIVDRYGLDRPDAGVNLAGLLRSAARLDGLRRLRFLTNHPRYLDAALIETVADEPRICPHFVMPFQSGSDAVLARMRRGYTAEDYRARVAAIRARLPEASIQTDIIVGFPGETEADFAATANLLEELRLDKVHIARYSPRPQTWAARRLPDDVPAEEKERRRAALDAIQTRILSEKNAAFRGRVVDVLVEDRDPRRGRWRGRTPCDRLVFFEAPGNPRGRIVPVRIRETAPFSLIGAAESANPTPP